MLASYRIYVNGYWKTDNNVPLAIVVLHFIAPSNSHTHTLPMHCCINRLSRLICFSRADFVNHVKSQLRHGPMEGTRWEVYGSDIHPCVSETSLKLSRFVSAYY